MRVLIANHSLCDIGGVQTYERDLALWLLAHGHSPVIYAPALGVAARQFDRLTIPIVDDLRKMTASVDIIHGDSATEMMAALLHFPGVPAAHVFHGWQSLTVAVPQFPRILRYVAVDDTCADRLLACGVPPERVTVLLNAVDLSAFRRRDELPPKPRRAVVFGNAAHELTFLPAIREACRRAGIEVDVIGSLTGTAVERPELILARYDIAFAKAKCAMEAMACGLAVIVCGPAGVSGMVRLSDFDRLRRLNFGIRTMQQPSSVEVFTAAIAAYDAAEAAKVSDRLRESAPDQALHESILAIYESVLEEHRSSPPPDWVAESRATAAFMHSLALRERDRELQVSRLYRASQRILSLPLLGPLATRALKAFGRGS